ncbi:MAG TPA: vitamin B12-dependent ribonucleotide reductase, partial [Lacipirellulaceae bacterium]|nr:vitamin B12-dependent ribonucleotide reductase [Lacipirellulaceae bacterium]
AKAKDLAKPRRERLPDTRQSITHKFSIVGHEGYITVGLYPDGRPGELFITMAKEGSTIGGLMDAFGTAVSMSLQYGVPLEDYIRKFSHMRFEPQGHTKNPDIRYAKSLIDYIFRWLGITFLPGYKEANLGMPLEAERAGGASPAAADDETAETQLLPVAKKADGRPGGQDVKAPSSKRTSASSERTGTSSERVGTSSERAGASPPPANGNTNGNGNGHKTKPSATMVAAYNAKMLERAGLLVKNESAGPSLHSEQFAQFQTDAPPCDNCGTITVRNGNCYLCHNCGNSMGCS